MINNAVYHGDKVIGFRCLQCHQMAPAMWGCICNSCREQNRKHDELIEAIKSLKEPPC